uniref:Uncharacterized protein n=1 Tax=Rhizophora mucronata TaxID=61149 RepID=A0A2P2MX60_RHIMU
MHNIFMQKHNNLPIDISSPVTN